MKFFLVLFLMASQSFAQDDSKCRLEVKTLSLLAGTSLQNNIIFSKNPIFMEMLERKGYSPFFTEASGGDDWDLASRKNVIEDDLLQKLDNKMLLRISGFVCTETATKTLSISIGSWSKSSGTSGKWTCNPRSNRILIKAISKVAIMETPYLNLGEDKKVFSSKAEAESYLVQEISKNLPSCQEYRKKIPDLGKVKVPQILNDFKEIQSTIKTLPPAQDEDTSIKNDNAAKVIEVDHQEQDSKGTSTISK